MMTNEELKKKIAQIIADYFCPQRNEHKNLWGDDRLCYSKMNFAERERVAECTDALIAAGIVDKSDYASMKETAVRYKAEVSKAGARVKEAEAEANRYEMLYKLQNRDMALAERRAHDAEHRAARAERALRDELVQKAIRLGVIDIRPWYIQALNEAEKKIAAEGKDD